MSAFLSKCWSVISGAAMGVAVYVKFGASVSWDVAVGSVIATNRVFLATCRNFMTAWREGRQFRAVLGFIPGIVLAPVALIGGLILTAASLAFFVIAIPVLLWVIVKWVGLVMVSMLAVGLVLLAFGALSAWITGSKVGIRSAMSGLFEGADLGNTVKSAVSDAMDAVEAATV